MSQINTQNIATLTPQDMHNLHVALTRITPANYEDAEILVVLRMKLGQILQQVQKAQFDSAVAKAAAAASNPPVPGTPGPAGE